MQQKTMRLGPYEMQFFAWTALKKREQVSIGDIAKVLGISQLQERELLSRLTRRGLIVRLRRGLYLVPPQIPPGGHWTPGEFKIVASLMNDLRASYQMGGQVAFHHHGLDDQVPGNFLVFNSKISRQTIIAGVSYTFVKTPKSKLGAADTIVLFDGTKVLITNKARTILDAVQEWRRFNTLPRSYRWIENCIDNKSFVTDLIKITISYGNMGTRRRIGYFLESKKISKSKIAPLLASVMPTSSFIPLIPTQKSIGTINRKWGVLINGEV